MGDGGGEKSQQNLVPHWVNIYHMHSVIGPHAYMQNIAFTIVIIHVFPKAMVTMTKKFQIVPTFAPNYIIVGKGLLTDVASGYWVLTAKQRLPISLRLLCHCH